MTLPSLQGCTELARRRHDRADALDAVKIAVLSIRRHELDLAVSVGPASANGEIREWFGSRGVTLTVGQDFRARGWDVKPGLLLSRLAEGAGQVLWWDSDVVASGPFRHLFEAHADDVVVATEDTYWGQEQGGDQRALAWGLTPGRPLAATVNTGLLRVSTRHRALLTAWREALQDPRYVAAQRIDMLERPLHLLGDQEVLTALLGSTGFAEVPVHLLRRGVDDAQCFGPAGYRVTERVHGLRTGAGLPPLVHATNPKPWRVLLQSRPGMLRSPQSATGALRLRGAARRAVPLHRGRSSVRFGTDKCQLAGCPVAGRAGPVLAPRPARHRSREACSGLRRRRAEPTPAHRALRSGGDRESPS